MLLVVNLTIVVKLDVLRVVKHLLLIVGQLFTNIIHHTGGMGHATQWQSKFFFS